MNQREERSYVIDSKTKGEDTWFADSFSIPILPASISQAHIRCRALFSILSIQQVNKALKEGLGITIRLVLTETRQLPEVEL